MSLVFLALPGNEDLARTLASSLDADVVDAEFHTFPDGETYVRLRSDVSGRTVGCVCTLDRPDSKLLPLYFVARLLKDSEAREVGLVAPYLAYMRQDRVFKPGEAITSLYFANLLSSFVDWLVTIDPHLHRRSTLNEIYAIETRVVHAAPLIAAWIRSNLPEAVLIGPDSESEQWVKEIADDAGIPFVVLEKQRSGDRAVKISMPHLEAWRDRVPVLVDDIISTGRTMTETIRNLVADKAKAPVCVGIHAVFAEGALDGLKSAGAGNIVTCTTIPHETNAIDISNALADAIRSISAV